MYVFFSFWADLSHLRACNLFIWRSRTQEVISNHDKTSPVSQILVPGCRLRLQVHIPPSMDDAGTKATTSEEIVLHVDDVNFRLAWRFATPARWLLNTERWQILRDGGPDGQTTVYETWEHFGGFLAYVIRFFMRIKLQSSFNAMSSALKDRAEQAD